VAKLSLLCGVAEELFLRAQTRPEATVAPDENNLVAFSRLATVSVENIERELGDTIATLAAQVRRLETVIDNLSQGVCFFDSEERLIPSNRRYSPCAGRHASRSHGGGNLQPPGGRRDIFNGH
jgi:hypothetical protein